VQPGEDQLTVAVGRARLELIAVPVEEREIRAVAPSLALFEPVVLVRLLALAEVLEDRDRAALNWSRRWRRTARRDVVPGTGHVVARVKLENDPQPGRVVVRERVARAVRHTADDVDRDIDTGRR